MSRVSTNALAHAFPCLLAGTNWARPAWFALLALLGCAPTPRGPWRTRPAAAPHRGLTLRPCAPTQTCALRFVSPSGQPRLISKTSTESSPLWLTKAGNWVQGSEAPDNAVLELWRSLRAPALQTQRKIPRWLVLTTPVESAGQDGMGTQKPRVGFTRLPLALRQALIAGSFDAVIAAGQEGFEFLSDLERATMRSSRQSLKRQVFQIVLGPSTRKTWRFPSRKSRSHIPELWTKDPRTFVLVQGLEDQGPNLDLKFITPTKQASFAVPRLAAIAPALRDRYQVEPCLGCGPRRPKPAPSPGT